MKKSLTENLLLQFTVVSFIIALAILAATFITITNGSEETLSLLDAHDNAMLLGQDIRPGARWAAHPGGKA